MKNRLRYCIVLVMAAVMPLSAHHSFGVAFDVNKPVTLTGTVTRIEWTNPHSHVWVDVKDEPGLEFQVKLWWFLLVLLFHVPGYLIFRLWIAVHRRRADGQA